VSEQIINRVENSGLIQVDLDPYYPKGERVLFDIKDLLVDKLILVEKPFRKAVNSMDWTVYQSKYVGIICSADAIVPLWAFMLIASKLQPFVSKVIFGDKQALEKVIFMEVLETIDYSLFQDKNVIVKGCGKHPIPESVFVDFTIKLQAYAKNIMFGEACSAVPLYKKGK